MQARRSLLSAFLHRVRIAHVIKALYPYTV